ncbi:hypothetical protein WA026_011951 [Henosepilachna vigintioctopunctata]|uniref:Uncharacterized protein n=1 Tax=Henosepilachna vigintioctopunctata TaxID=420089 RepID=A0AAW1VDT4_9CUCU
MIRNPSPAPNRCASPEYFRGVHAWSPSPSGPPARGYEYVGVPLEPPPLPHNYDPDEEESGPSTAEIIANQSQDYIDEKLAEYQMTIYQLQEMGYQYPKISRENWVDEVQAILCLLANQG